MKIELLKPCVVAGHPGAQVGDILEVTSHTYQVLEGLNAARLVTDSSVKPAPAPAPEVIETRDPEPETRDPEPAEPHKRGRRKKEED